MKLKSSILTLVAILFAALVSGCASIITSGIQNISVQTLGPEGKEVRSAMCELQNSKGKWLVNSPGTVTVVQSNDDLQVLCNKETNEPGRASLVSSGKSVLLGNLIFGGGIGAIVDHNTGAAYEYPAFIQVLMGAFTTIERSQTPTQQPLGDHPSARPASEATPELRSHRNIVIPYPR